MTPTNPTHDANDLQAERGEARSTPRWTVLLVDDERDILYSIKLLAERSKKGVKVITATSGAAGLEILATTHVDLLISDFKMPVMDGIEFLAKARELLPEVPRVMFTAYADAELARRAFAEAFVSDFLPKTLAPKQLVEKIESLLVEPADPGGGAAPVQESSDSLQGADGVAS